MTAELVAQPSVLTSPFDGLFASVRFWADLSRQADAYGPAAPPEWRDPLARMAEAARDLVVLAELERAPWHARDRIRAAHAARRRPVPRPVLEVLEEGGEPEVVELPPLDAARRRPREETVAYVVDAGMDAPIAAVAAAVGRTAETLARYLADAGHAELATRYRAHARYKPPPPCTCQHGKTAAP